MAKQQKLQQYIFKISSNLLAKNNWDLSLPLQRARLVPGLVVSLADSQILTWIHEINGTEDYDDRAKMIKKEIKICKRDTNSKENRVKIKKLYADLYDLQFVKDYITVMIQNNSQYDRCNDTFKVNGVTYRRLLCTNNGVKVSEVVYCNAEIWSELYKRMDNGRNHDVPLVAAKLGSYQALVSSASVPVSWPKGTIVVSDCITKFRSDLINIDDSDTTIEPVVAFAADQECENNCSDGCGMMLPDLARRWHMELEGNDSVLSGCNLRCSWTKGMVFPFDFIEFAEKVAHSYIIKDVWGHDRDVRDAELILTESQLKLWSCYASWEDYYNNCVGNHYTFRVTKTAPEFEDIDNVRQLNYQYIGCLEMSDKQIEELVAPTVNEIQDIMGFDHRKSLVYLCGNKLRDDTIQYMEPMCRALMIEPRLINDSYVRNRIKKMIARRIQDAKVGVLDVNGNFSILSGDLYALCEHMFGLEVHGLLDAGEVYSAYWKNKGVPRVLCARSPMSNAHSLLSRKISYSDDASYWFRYIQSCIILNAWDTSCASLNGCDFDGDLLFTTSNKVLLECQHNLPALNCIQYKAKKCVVEEDDLITANKNGFGSKIGSITNRITQMTSLMSNFSLDDEEYKILKYRTQCGQAQQQAEIDKVKGIVSNPMPKSWYIWSENKILEDDDQETINQKQLYQRVCAHKKPYFFQWNYAYLRTEYVQYRKTANEKSQLLFKKSLDELLQSSSRSDEEEKFVVRFYNQCELDFSPSTMNRICWSIENIFDGHRINGDVSFDNTILKTDKGYTAADKSAVLKLCKEYKKKMSEMLAQTDEQVDGEQMRQYLIQNLSELVSNEEVLCNILIDVCQAGSVNKQILWDACGEEIVRRLLVQHNYKLSYPSKDEFGEFECCGSRFHMVEITYGGESDADI